MHVQTLGRITVALVMATPFLVAQTDAVPDAGAKADRKQAGRLIRLLELPNRRAKAAPELLAMGSRAVPALIRALSDPRAEVVSRLALVLRMLGDGARPAIPKLRAIAGDKDTDPAVARAARWALSAFEPEGIAVIAEYDTGKVREIDSRGKEVFSVAGQKNVFDARRLPNGNYLVALCGTERTVREITRKGKVVWSYKGAQRPMSAERLPSGNTLICSSSDKGVIEVDPAGKVVWQFKTPAPYNADRLPNGNTLIADYTKHHVVEVDRAGVVKWRFGGAKGPLDADRLANGNTLIAAYTGKEVLEVTPAGKTVMRLSLKRSIDSACRLPDGRTLVGGQKFLHLYDTKGILVWEAKVARAASVKYY